MWITGFYFICDVDNGLWMILFIQNLAKIEKRIVQVESYHLYSNCYNFTMSMVQDKLNVLENRIDHLERSSQISPMSFQVSCGLHSGSGSLIANNPKYLGEGIMTNVPDILELMLAPHHICNIL